MKDASILKSTAKTRISVLNLWTYKTMVEFEPLQWDGLKGGG